MKLKKKYKNFWIKNHNQLILFLILFFILLFGFYLRVKDVPDKIAINTVSYYYKLSMDLKNENQYPLDYSEGLYPVKYKENSPPFLALFTFFLYKLSSPLHIDFYYFIIYFPLLMYLSLFIFGFIFVANLYNKTAGLFFVVLLSIAHLSVKLTVKGYYTEETLGVLLILFSIFFLIKSEKNSNYVFLAILALTLLQLTWQVFIFVLMGVLILLVIKIKSKKHLIKYLAILILPLLLAHMISIYFIGIDYSPISMFKESYLGVRESNTEDFKIAFDRVKLQPMELESFIESYSHIGAVFLIFGLFICLKNIKQSKYHTILIFTILSMVFLLKYTKFRFFALVPILIMSSIGLEAVLNKSEKYKKYFILIALIIAGGFLIMANYHPKCNMELSVPEKMKINETYNITIQVKNTGKNPLCSNKLFDRNRPFGGLHIEVENAKIINKKVHSLFTSVQTMDQYSINDIDWFEVTIDCLKKSAVSKVKFTVRPYKLPIKINYRCWIPDKCNEKPSEELRPEYRISWRNEKCLQRSPEKGQFCKVKVYAGYREKQDYSCFSEMLY